MSLRWGGAAPAKLAPNTNRYVCGVERNQNGKYNVRVHAAFNPSGRDGWALAVYFLASSFNAAMKKLEESLQVLQKNEDRLRFWAVERTDDPNLAGDFLKEFGLWLDRRQDFPRKTRVGHRPRARCARFDAGGGPPHPGGFGRRAPAQEPGGGRQRLAGGKLPRGSICRG